MKILSLYRLATYFMIFCMLLLISSSAVYGAVEGSKVFKYTCGSCHSIGKGKMVGPDLMNITSRRSTEWISNFIRSSQTLIKSGDPVAVALFKEFNQSVMPDHPDITQEEIDAILTYIQDQSNILAARNDKSLEKTDRSKIRPARSINVESISINDPFFKLLYWITAAVVISAIFTIGWYIARLSQ